MEKNQKIRWEQCFHVSTSLQFMAFTQWEVRPHTQWTGGSVGGNPPAAQETWVGSLGREDPLEEGMATHSSYSSLENPMDRGAWWTVGLQRVGHGWATKPAYWKSLAFRGYNSEPHECSLLLRAYNSEPHERPCFIELTLSCTVAWGGAVVYSEELILTHFKHLEFLSDYKACWIHSHFCQIDNNYFFNSTCVLCICIRALWRMW